MTARSTLAEVYGPVMADEILTALRAAGWIVVRHDAIRLAQAHAADEARSGKRTA